MCFRTCHAQHKDPQNDEILLLLWQKGGRKCEKFSFLGLNFNFFHFPQFSFPENNSITLFLWMKIEKKNLNENFFL